MDERFPGNSFEIGYSDQSITSASWILPGQKEDLLSTYEKLLEAEGKKTLAAKLMPGIRFSTSDTGVASASAYDVLMSMQEILFNLKVSGAPESKLLSLQENMARALTLRWSAGSMARKGTLSTPWAEAMWPPSLACHRGPPHWNCG